MWAISKHDRNRMVNLDSYDSISVNGSSITLSSKGVVETIGYHSDQEARQSYGYILEAMRRGDKLTQI